MKLLCTVALLVFAAGCVQPTAAPVATTGLSGDLAEPTVTTYRLSGGVPLAVAGRPLVPSNPPPEEWIVWFNVTNQTRQVRVTVAWTDPTGLEDLDAAAKTDAFTPAADDEDPTLCNNPPTYPNCRGHYTNPNGSYGAPDSPSVLTVNEPDLRAVQDVCGDPCLWRSTPWSKGVYANVTWTITVQVVDSSTALPPSWALAPVGPAHM